MQARLTKMHLNTLAEMPLATSYSPFSFLVVYSIVEPNILKYNYQKVRTYIGFFKCFKMVKFLLLYGNLEGQTENFP